LFLGKDRLPFDDILQDLAAVTAGEVPLFLPELGGEGQRLRAQYRMPSSKIDI
jgi:hypothetical protein